MNPFEDMAETSLKRRMDGLPVMTGLLPGWEPFPPAADSPLLEMPVDWYDSPEVSDGLTNNDDTPTPSRPGDYFLPHDIPYESHPDMWGYTCSTGFHHRPPSEEPTP